MDDLATPASLRVHIEDLSGAPVAGARVVLAGRGLQTDAHGDAAWEGLPPGAAAVSARASGFASATRPVWLREGDQARLWLTLPPVGAQGALLAGEPLALAEGGFGAALPADSLLDWQGEPFEGEARLRWTWMGAAAPHGPGPRVGLDEAGEAVGLDLVATLTVEAEDEDGAPLRPGAALALTAEGDEGGAVSLWRLDQAQGLWVWQADADSADGALRGEATSFGAWAFARPRALGGVALTVGCPDLDQVPVDLRVSDGATTFQAAVTSVHPTLSLDALPADALQVSLVVNDAVIRTETLEATAGGATSASSLSLDRCEGLGLALQTPGDCPADAVRLRVQDAAGAVLYSGTVPTPFLQTSLSSDGPVTLQSLDDDGVVVDERTVDLDPSSLTLAMLLAPEDRRRTPDGGCVAAPCLGGSCDGCLALSVFDREGAPSDGATLWLGEPAGGETTVDSDGEACVSSVAGAAQAAMTSEGLLGVARIPVSGRCGEPESCAAISLWTGVSSLPCDPDSSAVSFLATELGFAEPGAARAATLAWPEAAVGRGALHLDEGEVSLGELGPLEALDCEDGAFASLAQNQSASGLISTGDLELRCRTRDGVWLTLELALGLTAPGVRSVGDTTGAARLRLRLEDEATGDLVSGSAYAGEVAVWAYTDTWIGLDLNVRLPGALWTGHFAAPLLSAADAPRLLSALATQDLLGAWAGIRTADGIAPRRFGPSGGEPTEYRFGTGPRIINLCLKADTASGVIGEPTTRGGVMPPFLPQLSLSSELLLAGNSEPESVDLVPSALTWVRADLVRTLYERNGRDPLQATLGATILGQAWELREGALSTMGRFGTIYLESTDGTRITGERLSEDLRVGAVGAQGWFVFFGVPPAEEGEVYTLVLEDTAGRPVEVFTQQVAPVAGGVLLIGR